MESIRSNKKSIFRFVFSTAEVLSAIYEQDSLGVNLDEVQAIVISHGHSDHTTGLSGLIKRMGSQKVFLVAHPDAWLEKKLIMPGGKGITLLKCSRS